MGIGVKELVIILLIVLLVFGAKKLKTIGADLGSAVRGFKKGLNDEEESEKDPKQLRSDQPDAEFAERKAETKEKDRQA